MTTLEKLEELIYHDFKETTKSFQEAARRFQETHRRFQEFVPRVFGEKRKIAARKKN
jgi:hypothetical protein